MTPCLRQWVWKIPCFLLLAARINKMTDLIIRFLEAPYETRYNIDQIVETMEEKLPGASICYFIGSKWISHQLLSNLVIHDVHMFPCMSLSNSSNQRTNSFRFSFSPKQKSNNLHFPLSLASSQAIREIKWPGSVMTLIQIIATQSWKPLLGFLFLSTNQLSLATEQIDYSKGLG